MYVVSAFFCQESMHYNVPNTNYSSNKLSTEIHEPCLIIIIEKRQYFLIMQISGHFLYL